MTASVLQPMLAITAGAAGTTEMASLIFDAAWIAEEKIDGQRILLDVSDGEVTCHGREGQDKTGVPDRVRDEFARAPHGVYDGEVLDGSVHLFDLVDRVACFEDRWRQLRRNVNKWRPDPAVVVVLRLHWTAASKAGLVAATKAAGKEGVCWRNLAGLYRPGRSPDLLRTKHLHELEAVVVAVGRPAGVNNAILAVLDPHRPWPEGLVEVGSVSAAGHRPQPGEVWTARHEGVYDPDNPRLYHPRLIRRRPDVAMASCLLGQLDGAWRTREPLMRTRA
jgi:ATP-dependent DNA ligase